MKTRCNYQKACILIAGFLYAAGIYGKTPEAICIPVNINGYRCEIRRLSDCQSIYDYPYARNLFCPASFSAARAMGYMVANTLGLQAPSRTAFYLYQTAPEPLSPPDNKAQTTTACLDTPKPWAYGEIAGAGVPVCHLLAYATSVGPINRKSPSESVNPVPSNLRDFPRYFRTLYAPTQQEPLTRFRSGSLQYDPIVRALGSAAYDGFLADYPGYSPTNLYDPASWHEDAN
jgi:hypothetical protein